MSTIDLTIKVATTGNVLGRQVWASLATSDSAVLPVKLDADGKRAVKVSKGRLYLVFWQFFGNPGATLSLKISAKGQDKPLLEVGKSTIPPGRSYQAGVREFTP